MFHKTKNENIKYFFKSCVQCFCHKNVSTEHKEVCLSINGAQSVRLEKETFEFKNNFKQMPVSFKVYADFECNFKTKALKVMKVVIQKYIKTTFLVVLLVSLFLLTINLPSQQLLLEIKMLLMNLLKQFLRSMNTVRK